MAEYKLVFSGRLAEGKAVEEVKQAARAALKLSPQAIEKLFDPSRAPVVVKKLQDPEQASRFVSRFKAVGMILELTPSELSVEPVAEPAAASPSQPLALVEEPEPIAESSDSEEGEEVEEDKTDWLQAVLVNVRAVFSLPILLIIVGLLLGVLYAPYPDGMLRYGFVAGGVLLIVGVKMLR